MSSFSDLIKNISSTTPAELDPEDSYHSIDSKPTKNQHPNQYQSVSPSKLRNQFEFEFQNDTTDKYSGKKVSRKDIELGDSTSIPENNPLVKQLQASVKADILKGKAIKSQLAIYDSLLGLRISIQKILTATNEISQIMPEEGISCETDSVVNSLISLSSSIGNLRSEMMVKNDLLEVPERISKKRKAETDLDSCLEETKELDTILSPYLRTTISKWSTKINSASSLTQSNKKFNAVNQNAMNQLDTLWSMPGEKERYIERTRLKRNDKKKTKMELDQVEEIDAFDDRDFYFSLLKEVVDTNLRETDPTSFPSNRSQRTHKQGVDPKASKGRKIRYNVHEKLVSFMVPICTDLWTEESKDELFGSLLGRGFEGSGVISKEEKEVGLGSLKLL
ncbi:apoptosis antagonizing transcription factor-domain-containing protein [Melampsora americana]|nr:apoptosis antagonizing transcription factor-domain-containing protein [Melampsora americana]